MYGQHGSAAAEMEAFVQKNKAAAALKKAANEPPSSDKKKSKRELKKEKKASEKKEKAPQTPVCIDAVVGASPDGKVPTKRSSEKQGLTKILSSKLFKKKKKGQTSQEESDAAAGSSETDNPLKSANTSLAQKSEEELAMEKIQQTIERQEKREEILQEKMKHLVVDAKKKLSTGDRKGALYDVKRKKFFEGELDTLQQAKFTMETQIFKIESAIENREMYEAMATGSHTMKKLQSDVGIDEVDTVMENIREEMESALEINEALGQDVIPTSFDDDDALLAELISMDRSDSSQSADEVPPSLPVAPTDASFDPPCFTDPHSEKRRQMQDTRLNSTSADAHGSYMC
mmetsp:Transcript_9503/g.15797  ORF Transcript_9503/g.15797 Transcript_9503/m.15797 type:complete len:345 (+) Transcript_9503:182-1216(+)|eukprot:CAMPEP_0119011778 /NCGR_PEP_ID=MMETSP1176-20130426/5883_1 /TAXON_ID=265551 /ORGANISM="Synedropsis recta cf, Strain CCMP1620" /LENGTH=344 /DNA_ID=CAMNT_0006964641 /DNA_START=145 /DNA_END=1179 /DNA_ORIENTATION=-